MQQEEKFRHLYDTRSADEILRQTQQIERMLSNNTKNFNMEMTAKQKVNYTVGELIKVQLGDGWYCHITDNMLIPARFTVLTVHGCPGDHREWAGLEYQMLQRCRWINLTIPGYDGEDQRRGTYNGSLKHLSELIIRLMKSRGIPKIVFCGHSMGSMAMIHFATHHPEYIDGTVNITGLDDVWYIGLMTFYNVIVVQSGLNKMREDRNAILDNDQYRKKLAKDVNDRGKDVRFGVVSFPPLTESEICAYIKLLNSKPTGLSELYEQNRVLLPHRLKVYIYGRIDPLHSEAIVHEMMYRKCFNQEAIKLIRAQIETVRKRIDSRCRSQEGVMFNFDNPQHNFCWYLPETGHNAHKRRPKQIAKVLRVYLIVLDEISKHPEAKL